MEPVDNFVNEADFRLFRHYCRFKEILIEEKKAPEQLAPGMPENVSLGMVEKLVQDPLGPGLDGIGGQGSDSVGFGPEPRHAGSSHRRQRPRSSPRRPDKDPVSKRKRSPPAYPARGRRRSPPAITVPGPRGQSVCTEVPRFLGPSDPSIRIYGPGLSSPQTRSTG
ncbi:hypothetical protein PoB_001292400 [Plakobranchus ocellatus]|uniref:Uncharacterized protein n=1 Tax=Plakobranchus ocellatus TaxID=259542 RepID=A0AAV3YWI3_9GAST|nr:hypothetical protein PoB_001292400 [Plakobranchus ocellatus]